jgi:hypothetical protein
MNNQSNVNKIIKEINIKFPETIMNDKIQKKMLLSLDKIMNYNKNEMDKIKLKKTTQELTLEIINDEKKNELEKILSKLKTSEITKIDKKKEIDEIVNEINIKFPEILKYNYIDVNKLRPGMIVRYVDHDMLKMSPSVFISHVATVNVPIVNKNTAKIVSVINNTMGYIASQQKYGHGVSNLYVRWKINAQKYYFFEYIGSGEAGNLIKNINDDYLLEQIELYKKSLT